MFHSTQAVGALRQAQTTGSRPSTTTCSPRSSFTTLTLANVAQSPLTLATKAFSLQWYGSITYKCNTVAYNTIVGGFISNGLEKDGSKFYKHIRWGGVMPNMLSFRYVIKACSNVMEIWIFFMGCCLNLGRSWMSLLV